MGKFLRTKKEDLTKLSWWVSSIASIGAAIGALNLIFNWFTDWVLIGSLVVYVTQMITTAEYTKE